LTAAVCRGSVSRYLGLLAGAMGRTAEARTYFRRARTANERAGARTWLARTLLDHGALVQRTASSPAEREEARELLERAQSLAAEIGMPRVQERAAALLVTGTAPSYPDGLSAREVEVLRLVAAGRSNGEIAAALTISPHTAVRHVSNILAKIRAENRAEAASYAARYGLL
jgi:DNA-binding CsgD family transcriptional regulator